VDHIRLIAAAVAGVCLSASALGQQLTRIIVPFAAGGGTHQYCQILAEELTTRTGMSIVIENKPGASGIVAADYVARAKADGQTVLASSLGTLANSSVLYEKLPYDAGKDFVPVGQIGYQPAIIVGRTDLPYKKEHQGDGRVCE